MEIRAALPADAEQIAEVHVGTWQHAYRGLIPDAHLDALAIDTSTERWRRNLTGPATDPRDRRTIVAADGDRILGFATSGVARDPEPPASAELWAIYVRPAAYGSGAGAALLEHALGADPAYLWVLEGNARAIRFYEKHGFVLDGSVKIDDRETFVLRELRMTRA